MMRKLIPPYFWLMLYSVKLIQVFLMCLLHSRTNVDKISLDGISCVVAVGNNSRYTSVFTVSAMKGWCNSSVCRLFLKASSVGTPITKG